MARTKIPLAGANARMGEHNFFDFRHYHPTAGNIWFVDSGVNGTGGLSPEDAFGTVAEAISAGSAGDVVYFGEGHAENISDAAGFAASKAGMSFIGLGRGARRATFTLDTAAAATIGVTGAACLLKNFNILSNYTGGVTAGITLGAAADGTYLDDILMTETAATEEYLVGVSIAAACANVRIQGLVYRGTAAGSSTNCILCAGAADGLVIKDCMIHGDFSGAAIDGTAAACAFIHVARNVVHNLDTGAGLGIAFHNSSTGFVNDNRITNLKDTVAGVSGTGLSYHENYGSNAAGAQGTVAIALAVDT